MATSVPLNAQHVLDLLPPYPIVLVTVGANIITINQIAYLTFSPLRLGIGVARTRYTYELLKEHGAFVVNVPGPDLLEAVKLCGSVSGREFDKFSRAGLTQRPSEEVPVPGIDECGGWIECRVERHIDFEERTWFVGLVVAAQRRVEHQGMEALMCGRGVYALPGDVIAPR
jgi:flavin reductase (DIM6/NTAB) family NADH-FMN oxidoreductase RutF